MIRNFIILIFVFCSFVQFNFAVDVTLSSQKLGFGEPIKIIVRTKDRIKKQTILFANKSFKCFLVGRIDQRFTYVGYVAGSRYLDPGDYLLKLNFRFSRKNKFYQQYKIVLDYPKKRKLGNVSLTKKAKTVSKRTDDYRKESRLLAKNFKKLTNKQYFSGPFIMPAKGRLSSGFGVLRRYNNGRTSSHAGLDIANKVGTSIFSPAKGVVILSKTLTIHGNTIMVDHGYGVISVFCHLDKRFVRKGDYVQTGAFLGEMGMTGVVSGTHLHWGISVQNVRVNPLYFIKEESHFFNLGV